MLSAPDAPGKREPAPVGSTEVASSSPDRRAQIHTSMAVQSPPPGPGRPTIANPNPGSDGRGPGRCRPSGSSGPPNTPPRRDGEKNRIDTDLGRVGLLDHFTRPGPARSIKLPSAGLPVATGEGGRSFVGIARERGFARHALRMDGAPDRKRRLTLSVRGATGPARRLARSGVGRVVSAPPGRPRKRCGRGGRLIESPRLSSLLALGDRTRPIGPVAEGPDDVGARPRHV